jgi:tRNA modification GTPase
MPPDIMLEKLLAVKNELEKLRESYSIGRIISDGLNCAIIGKPNAGKSTFLNMLSQNDIAIVHDTPGTTRDIVYSRVNIGGFALNLYDTAGIRASEDEIENIGIEKARAKIAECGLIIGVFDVNDTDACGGGILDILQSEKNSGKKTIAVLNKCDICRDEQCSSADMYRGEQFWRAIDNRPYTTLKISAKNNTVFDSDISAYDAFGKCIEDIYGLDGYDLDSGEILTEERQYFEICAACDNLSSAISALENGLTQDIAGLDLELAVKNLERCDSKSVSEDIVDRIFRNFCIGK